MTVSIVNKSHESITLEVKIPFNRSMLDSESSIQDALNEVGCIATSELLKTFDTEGEAIQFGSVKMTTKGQVSKLYQIPYGEVEVSRHVYQTSEGGTTLGSGVTETACKTIVKQRLGESGMKWKNTGAGVILSLRTLAHSSGCWE